MSQEGWSVFLNIFWYGGHAWIAEKFFRRCLECTRNGGRLFAVLLFFSYGMCDFICRSAFYPAGTFCFFVILLGLVFLLFRGEMEKKLLMAVIWKGLSELAVTAGDSCFYIISLLFHHGLRGETAFVHSRKEEALGVLAGLAAVAGLAYLLMHFLESMFEKKSKSWYFMLAVPIVFLVVLMDTVTWGATKGIMFRGADRWNLFYNQLFSNGANLALSLICMCSAGFYMFGMDRIYMEQRRREQYQSQVAVYKMLEEQYRQMERLRHDMKNHVTGLQGLLEHREWEKMEDYLVRMAETGALGGSEEATGNKVVDALLYQKRKEAEGRQIRWKAHMQVPKNSGIDDFDFCVLIGNILDNALKACESMGETAEKFITIQSGVKKSFFLLEAKNSTDPESVKPAAAAGQTGAELHGTGLLNMREAAGKYNGTVKTELKHSVFTVTVLLPLAEDDTVSEEPYVTSEKPFETES